MRHLILMLAMTMAEAPPQAPPVRVPPQAPPVVAPEVAPAKAKTFPRAVNYGRVQSHNCPGCLQEQLRQAGRGPERGTHWHVCENCQSRWFH